MLKICEADLADPVHADALVRLLDCYARDPMGAGAGLSDYARENIARVLARRQGCSVILAYLDTQAVGLLISFEGFSTFACRPLLNIHDIVVVPECRGQGISTMMLAEAERIARERWRCWRATSLHLAPMPASALSIINWIRNLAGPCSWKRNCKYNDQEMMP